MRTSSFLLSLVLIALSAAQAQTSVPKKIALRQNDIAQLALGQSDRSLEANLKSELPRLDLAKAKNVFDWRLLGSTGYETSRFESLSGYGNIEDQILKSNLELSKYWSTGTKTSLSWLRNSYRSEYSPLSPSFSNIPAEQTQDIFGFTLEQSLWRNSFGYSDRRNLASAEKNMNAAMITRASDLQNVVLEALRAYWKAYMSQELMRQAIKSVERYETLVGTIRRKSNFGYATPGELPQVQAELEFRRQNVKTTSMNYLRDSEALIEMLRLPADSEIEFITDVDVKAPPGLPAVKLDDLRAVRSQILKMEAAEMKVEAARRDESPAVALVGQVYGGGLEERPEDAIGEALSGTRPKYYVGIKFEHNFGAGLQAEETVNRKVQAELEKIRLERLKLQTVDGLANEERNTKIQYAELLSTKEQMDLREKAYTQMSRAYTQGRTDINFVIEALNRLVDAESAHSLAMGNYQIALATWSARRDELIPEASRGKE